MKQAKQTLLERLAKRGFGVGAVALGTVTGSVAVAPAALIGRTLSLLGSGVTVPHSVLVLTQGVTSMTTVRFKVLVTGVLVAGCLSLGAVSGWYSNASGQPTTDPAQNKPPSGQNDPSLPRDAAAARR